MGFSHTIPSHFISPSPLSSFLSHPLIEVIILSPLSSLEVPQWSPSFPRERLSILRAPSCRCERSTHKSNHHGVFPFPSRRGARREHQLQGFHEPSRTDAGARAKASLFCTHPNPIGLFFCFFFFPGERMGGSKGRSRVCLRSTEGSGGRGLSFE